MAQEKKKILIVEDNADWRLVLSRTVERAGYEVVSATTGREAVEKAAAAQPALILMDIGLPLMNGGEATALIKANAATKNIPVVIQTAYGSSSFTEHAVKAGAAEVLQKPIKIQEIERVLCKYAPRGSTNATRPATVSGASTATRPQGGRAQPTQ
jgi:CheY-like chemotaxis protein